MLKGKTVARDFYPFVEGEEDVCGVQHSARIAVYDDASAAPRVVVVEPKDVRSYLEEITQTVNKLSHEQGGKIPFMVIREIVENFIHAYFQSPTITILDEGNTIRFTDQGPGIQEKERALEYGTTSATEEMKHYIRGVGSGLPYAQQYMLDKGGSLQIEDNIHGGTVVTISTHAQADAHELSRPLDHKQAERTQIEKDAAKAPETAQTPAPKPASKLPFELDDQESAALGFIYEQNHAGPTDLARELGKSGPTWSRVLARLANKGLVIKDGQKYRLTEIGRAFV